MKSKVHAFQSYLSGVISAPTVVRPFDGKVPPFIEARYELLSIEILGRTFLGVAVLDVGEFSPGKFLKHIKTISQACPLEWVLLFEEIPSYLASRLRDLGFPFVVRGRQLFWTAIGEVLGSYQSNHLPRFVDTLSPISQALVVAILNQRIPDEANVTELAALLGVTKMSVSRALSELKAAKLPLSEQIGRDRIIKLPAAREQLWRLVQDLLTTPVREVYYLRKEDLPHESRIVAGETALGAVTSLVPPPIPVYAVDRRLSKILEAKKLPYADEAQDICLIEKWKYDPRISSIGNRVDTFSLYLSLKENPDERVQIALEDAIGEHLDTGHSEVSRAFRVVHR